MVYSILLVSPGVAWPRDWSNLVGNARYDFARRSVFIPPANFVCGGYTVFMLSVRA